LFVAAAAWVLPLAWGCGARSTLDSGELPPSMRPSLGGGAPVTPQGGSATLPPVELPPVELPPEPVRPARRPCESVSLTLDELRPAVTLLVDQSGSMRSRYPTRESEQTRWQVVGQALLDPMAGVVPTLQQSIQFGLVFYTSHNGFMGGACPIFNEVRSATGNYEAIRALYDSLYPDDDTPTGAAVQKVTRDIQMADRHGPEVILLVTDGDPDTCAQPDPQDGQAEAVNAVAAAHAAGIDFYVLGVSSDISDEKLQQLANAGQGKAIDARWGVDADAAQPFQASASVAGLTSQLREILARVPLCQVALDREVSVDELSAGNVVLDGQPLSYGSSDGFVLEDSRHLRIQGKACDTLRAAGKRLSVRISCD
jgi:hypothetical protein